MPYGFLCCGPSAENNVYYSSDEDSSSDDGEGDASATVIRWPEGAEPPATTPNAEAPSVLPSGIKKPKLRKVESVGIALSPEEELGFFDALAGSWKGMQASLRSLFSPRPQRRRRPLSSSRVKTFFDDNEEEGGNSGGGGGRGGQTKTDEGTLDLAFRETRRLPDVAGEERVAWAAGVLRIDLTETGIRTLRGLDAFPNVQTLVLDSNGLLSLPMDCPWVPSLETLWLCNNEVENLDGLLCQVNDVFPRLKSLALMGNPVWPAAKSRARGGDGALGTPPSSTERRRRSSSTGWVSPGDTSAAASAVAVVAAAAEAAATAAAAAAGTEERGVVADEEAGRTTGSSVPAGDDGHSGGDVLRWEGKEEEAYRLNVVRRLPGLVTLDCADVTEKERARAKEGNGKHRLMDVTDLLLEPEPTTDVEESLPRDTPPGSARSVSHGVGKKLEEERERRSNLPDRGSLPSTWYKEAIVMDVGSGWTRMGLAGEDTPSCVFPTVVGRVDLRAYDRVLGQDEKVFVGHNAVEEANKRAAQRDLPDGHGPMPSPIFLQHPLSNGVVTDWDDMEQLWHFGIEEEMGLEAMEHPVLMADSTAAGPSEREKATEVLMETLATPAVHIALQPVLALYACGPSSGLVVDIGESGTQVAPIFDGFVLEKGLRHVALGGRDITKNLGALVNAKVGLIGGEDFEMDNPCDLLKLEALKAKVCFVSENIDQDNARMELSMTKPYILPDGTRITLGRERYRASELLFDPGMALREEESLQNTILDSILACERKAWAILAQTVILTGGTTEMSGLNRRLQRELTKASRANGIRLKFTVMVPEDDHNNTVWVGGSMLASTSALDGLWFTRAEYEEYGAGYIHAKFAA